MGFEAEWLAARGPYDEEALDPAAVARIRQWSAELPPGYAPVVVDLGSGTGAALERVRRWLGPREMVAYAVDCDPDLLQYAAKNGHHQNAVTVAGDLLKPLEDQGGPPDGSVDLVVGHALADLVPLDRLAARTAALTRPGGLVHLALAYDGVTAFSPVLDPTLDTAIVAAFHRHMDRPSLSAPDYGGSDTGRRLSRALSAAGLVILADAPSTWRVSAGDGPNGRRVLSRLIRFVVDAVLEVGGVSQRELARWEACRREALADGALTVRVEHRDVLAQVRVQDRICRTS